eukprot:209292-Pelagomonas_calceolata.AAC.1
MSQPELAKCVGYPERFSLLLHVLAFNVSCAAHLRFETRNSSTLANMMCEAAATCSLICEQWMHGTFSAMLFMSPV